ncbi:MAG TPA: M48 family metalloprotease [Ottowia sp.]|uniref:M48 family metalloprotease n=1 Tax=Ottowia sp. TaxID=1898956 RepID=UPI002C1E9AD0|nr:M48 family metalloprotease [Ottowia sp.]HMN22265.1 M48 family metalloprotease [Ottowia sp.]
MTTLEERKLGDAIIRELYRDPDYVDDAILGDYVDGIWQRLRAGARARGELPAELDERFAWQVLLGRDRTINAFALPGGYFGLHLGLVGVVGSSDELASVLAHEMSHITQRHIARMLSQESRQTPMLLAAMVLGALAATRNPQAGAALAVGGQAALIQQQLNYSRDMEREADRIGFGILTQAGFAPQGFASMFEKLQAASRINDNGDWPYLRSHPLTTERIADMQQRQQGVLARDPPAAGSSQGGRAPSGGSAPRAAGERGGQKVPAAGPSQGGRAPSGGSAPRAAGERGGPDLEALLLAARARVLSRPGVDLLRTWSTEPAHPGFADLPLARRAATLYAAALAQASLRELPRAQALAQELAQELGQLVAADAPALRQARLLQAELALQAGQDARALELLSELDRGGVPTRAVLLLRAQAQTRTGAAREAESALRIRVSEHPRDAGAWLALAQAEQAQGQALAALRAEGEARMAEMDYQGAIDRWRAAQELSRRPGGSAGDLIEASIVDTRLREAQAALKQQQLDEQKWR